MTDKKEEPNLCYGCKQVIIFDAKQKSPRGIPIPLDPDTGKPHDCPSENGNRTKQEGPKSQDREIKTKPLEPSTQDREIKTKPLEDHYTIEHRARLEEISRNLHSEGRLKILSGKAEPVEKSYNAYRKEIAKYGAKIDGCPSKVTTHGNEVLFTIFVYFEIPKEFAREVDALK